MTHNEERAHWIKEGAIGLGGKLGQTVSNVNPTPTYTVSGHKYWRMTATLLLR